MKAREFTRTTPNLNARVGFDRRKRLATAAETLDLGMSELLKSFIDECFSDYLDKRCIVESGGSMTITR